MKVISRIAALIAAFGCMSANATFIYLREGATRPAAVQGLSPNVTAGLAPLMSGWAHGDSFTGGMLRGGVSRSQEWTSLPTWFTLPRRGRDSARPAFEVNPATNPAMLEEAPAIVGTTLAPGLAAVLTVDSVDALAQSGTAVPVVTLATIAADLDFAAVSLVDATALAVPEPATVGLLGLGLLLTFVVAGRRSRRNDGANGAGRDEPHLG